MIVERKNRYLWIYLKDKNIGKDEKVNKFTIRTHNEPDILEVLEVLNRFSTEKLEISKIRIWKTKTLIPKAEWKGLPEAKYDTSLLNRRKIVLNCRDSEMREIISEITKIIPHHLCLQHKCIWYKSNGDESHIGVAFKDEGETRDPKYPIFIISKGRYKTRLTATYLDRIKVPYKMVVEESELELYKSHGQNPETLLVMPDAWKREQIEKGYGGGIPVRNFVHHYARYVLNSGRHWLLDDNIRDYARFYNSKRIKCYSKAVFTAVEDYVDRFTNLHYIGHNYQSFVIHEFERPVAFNVKCYSSLLIHNELNDYLGCSDLWRGVYNEDVDLTLRSLKAGFPTMNSNIFCAHKMPTMTNKGGNTSTIYAVPDAHKLKVESLIKQHPDCVEAKERFVGKKTRRIHHVVNYRPWKHLKPIPKPGLVIPDEPNEYGMVLTKN